MSSPTLTQAMALLQELAQDSTIPKNVHHKLSNVISMLQKNSEVSLNVSKALHELEDITTDMNLESFTRTQIFNVVSMLEVV
jgi:uncharacterized protein (UPF0147 family)